MLIDLLESSKAIGLCPMGMLIYFKQSLRNTIRGLCTNCLQRSATDEKIRN